MLLKNYLSIFLRGLNHVPQAVTSESAPFFFIAGQTNQARSFPTSNEDPSVAYEYTLDQDAHAAMCQVQPYTPPAVTYQEFPPFDHQKAQIYRYRQQLSVNLGSWFVLENWMTPSLFACASGERRSELDVASGWGSLDASRALLERHWDTFINQSDFKYLASIGINTVRLPIGYWTLGPAFCEGTPFSSVAEVYQDTWSRVARAINWAGEEGIGVLVDLHAGVGSQNGQDHSGISDGKTRLFSRDDYMDKTIDVLTSLTERLCNVTNIVGIQVLNEPSNDPSLPEFYSRAISSMRNVSVSAARFPLYIHDAFNLDKFAAYVGNRQDFVVEDHHSYFVFTPADASRPASEHTADVAGTVFTKMSQAASRTNGNLVIGEWSCALTPQSLEGEEDEHASRLAFCTEQLKTCVDTTAGCHFWSYKLEHHDAGWSFKDAVGKSLPTSFSPYGTMSGESLRRLDGLILSSPNAFLQPFSTPSSNHPPTTLYHHRSMSIHRRRESALTTSDIQPQSLLFSSGYQQGYAVGIDFARNGSRLGFIDQYIHDTIDGLSNMPMPVSEEMKEDCMRGFVKGLDDAENAIEMVLMM